VVANRDSKTKEEQGMPDKKLEHHSETGTESEREYLEKK